MERLWPSQGTLWMLYCRPLSKSSQNSVSPKKEGCSWWPPQPQPYYIWPKGDQCYGCNSWRQSKKPFYCLTCALKDGLPDPQDPIPLTTIRLLLHWGQSGGREDYTVGIGDPASKYATPVAPRLGSLDMSYCLSRGSRNDLTYLAPEAIAPPQAQTTHIMQTAASAPPQK